MKKLACALSLIVLGCSLSYAETAIDKKAPLLTQLRGEGFDNSIPGKWKLELKTSSLTEPEMNSVKVLEKCITKEDIEKSRSIKLVEKFNVGNGMSCQSDFKRTDNDTGTFNMVCVAKDNNKKPVELKVNGTILSKEKLSELKMDYSLKMTGKQDQFFKMETKSTFISAKCTK